MIDVPEPLTNRAVLARQVLQALPCKEDWMLLKGRAGLERLEGDLDLLVRPAAVDALERALVGFLRPRMEPGDWLVRCTHIPGVPRYFARLASDGFDEEVLEVDLATVVPFAGTPAVDIDALRPFSGPTSDGWAAPRAEAEEAVTLMFSDRPIGASSAAIEVVRHCVGDRAARHLAARRPRLARAVVAPRALYHPALLCSRVRFRWQIRLCPASPRAGRAARRASVAAAPVANHVLLLPDDQDPVP